jgi:glycosyltransferase involved in cell wall biosynthesis
MEAQILGKPVVITDYPTSGSQLENGVDGIIVPQDNEGCAKGIVKLLQDTAKRKELQSNCAKRDYSNAGEIEKLDALIE